jgi:pyruvate/2-oxoglutarate dehydrogenase complex dihydrolipoamide acyltransferase (E2) component
LTDVVALNELWNTDDAAVLSRWLYRDGERVIAGTTLCELMVEKVSFEIQAPATGVLRILVPEEALVSKAMKLGVIS